MPSLKQRLRQLELEREQERRHQLAHFDVHRFLLMAQEGKEEAEIARELGVAPDIAHQALGQLKPPAAAGPGSASGDGRSLAGSRRPRPPRRGDRRQPDTV